MGRNTLRKINKKNLAYNMIINNFNMELKKLIILTWVFTAPYFKFAKHYDFQFVDSNNSNVTLSSLWKYSLCQDDQVWKHYDLLAWDWDYPIDLSCQGGMLVGSVSVQQGKPGQIDWPVYSNLFLFSCVEIFFIDLTEFSSSSFVCIPHYIIK